MLPPKIPILDSDTKRPYLMMSVVALIILLLIPHPASATTERGIALRAKLAAASGKTIGTYRALIIGINEYQDNKIPDLKTAVNDARALSDLLKGEYGFTDVTLLTNREASSAAIERALRRLVDSLQRDSAGALDLYR